MGIAVCVDDALVIRSGLREGATLGPRLGDSLLAGNYFSLANRTPIQLRQASEPLRSATTNQRQRKVGRPPSRQRHGSRLQCRVPLSRQPATKNVQLTSCAPTFWNRSKEHPLIASRRSQASEPHPILHRRASRHPCRRPLHWRRSGRSEPPALDMAGSRIGHRHRREHLLLLAACQRIAPTLHCSKAHECVRDR